MARRPETHVYSVKPFILSHIISGRKNLEIRQKKGFWGGVIKCDSLNFNQGEAIRKIVAKRDYASLAMMLVAEDPDKILPDKSAEEIFNFLEEIYPENKNFRVLVFELAPA